MWWFQEFAKINYQQLHQLNHFQRHPFFWAIAPNGRIRNFFTIRPLMAEKNLTKSNFNNRRKSAPYVKKMNEWIGSTCTVSCNLVFYVNPMDLSSFEELLEVEFSRIGPSLYCNNNFRKSTVSLSIPTNWTVLNNMWNFTILSCGVDLTIFNNVIKFSSPIRQTWIRPQQFVEIVFF